MKSNQFNSYIPLDFTFWYFIFLTFSTPANLKHSKIPQPKLSHFCQNFSPSDHLPAPKPKYHWNWNISPFQKASGSHKQPVNFSRSDSRKMPAASFHVLLLLPWHWNGGKIPTSVKVKLKSQFAKDSPRIANETISRENGKDDNFNSRKKLHPDGIIPSRAWVEKWSEFSRPRSLSRLNVN